MIANSTKKPVWRDSIHKIIDFIKFNFSKPTYYTIEETEPLRKNPWITEDKPNISSIKPDVYFIQSEIGGPIKIGVSGNPQERMDSLQMYYPFKLLVIATIKEGGYKKESELHKRFAKYRLHGEWFDPVPELLDYINKNKLKDKNYGGSNHF